MIDVRTLRGMSSIVFVLMASVAHAASPPGPVGCGTITTTFGDTTPLAINDLETVGTTIEVSGLDPFLWDLDVRTFIRHTFNEDLQVTLTSPMGTTVTLSTGNGGGFDDVFNGTLWDDDAGDVNVPGPVTDEVFAANIVVSPLAPEEALGAFIGEDPNGIWTLEITDTVNGDTGTLDEWALNLTTIPGPPPAVTTDFNSVVNLGIPDPGTLQSDLAVLNQEPFICDVDLVTSIAHPFNGDLNITLFSPDGTEVTISTGNGLNNDNVFQGTTWDDNAGDTNPPGPVSDTDFQDLVVETDLVVEEALAAFIGEDPNGIWSLVITDDLGGESGALISWQLRITTCVLDTDEDGDGVDDACDLCFGDNAFGDSDGDLICDDLDLCLGDDFTDDTDGDGVCDDLDVCLGDDAIGDFDADGVCDDADLCLGDDVTGDTDGDFLCDDLDPCPLDFFDDSDFDGVCDGIDLCPGSDDGIDSDGDGIPDDCDAAPTAQAPPVIIECCGGGAPMMMPLMILAWSRLRKRSRLR